MLALSLGLMATCGYLGLNVLMTELAFAFVASLPLVGGYGTRSSSEANVDRRPRVLAASAALLAVGMMLTVGMLAFSSLDTFSNLSTDVFLSGRSIPTKRRCAAGRG
jgi:hypothetical protein